MESHRSWDRDEIFVSLSTSQEMYVLKG